MFTHLIGLKNTSKLLKCPSAVNCRILLEVVAVNYQCVSATNLAEALSSIITLILPKKFQISLKTQPNPTKSLLYTIALFFFKSTRGNLLDVISRLLVQDILSVNSPYARIRLRGSLVIAFRGFIRGVWTQSNSFCLLFLSLSARTDSILPLPHLSSAYSPSPTSHSFQPFVGAIMLHVWGLG